MIKMYLFSPISRRLLHGLHRADHQLPRRVAPVAAESFAVHNAVLVIVVPAVIVRLLILLPVPTVCK